MTGLVNGTSYQQHLFTKCGTMLNKNYALRHGLCFSFQYLLLLPIVIGIGIGIFFIHEPLPWIVSCLLQSRYLLMFLFRFVKSEGQSHCIAIPFITGHFCRAFPFKTPQLSKKSNGLTRTILQKIYEVILDILNLEQQISTICRSDSDPDRIPYAVCQSIISFMVVMMDDGWGTNLTTDMTNIDIKAEIMIHNNIKRLQVFAFVVLTNQESYMLASD